MHRFLVIFILASVSISVQNRNDGWEVLQDSGDCPSFYNGHVVVQVGPRTFVHGGLYDYIPNGGTARNETDTFYDTLYVIHQGNLRCTKLNPENGVKPSARSFHVAARDETLDDNNVHEFYLFGGGTYVSGGRNAVMNNELWRYDIRRNTFEQIVATNEGPSARFGPAMFIYEHKYLYIWGGTFASGNSFISLNDMWRLDLNTLTWELLPTPTPNPDPRFLPHFAVWQPTGRASTGRTDRFRVIVANGQAFVAFGPTNPISVTYNDVWEYSPSTHTWEKHIIVNPPAAPVRHAAFAIYRNTLILQGGTTDNDPSGAGFTQNQTLFYSLVDKTFTVIDSEVRNFRAGPFAKRQMGTITGNHMDITGGVGEIKTVANGPREQVWNNAHYRLQLTDYLRWID